LIKLFASVLCLPRPLPDLIPRRRLAGEDSVLDDLRKVHSHQDKIQAGTEDEQLTYCFSGRDFRLTDVAGRVIHDIIA
jgi:hypothetical protein